MPAAPNDVALSLGCNVGACEATLRTAVAELASLHAGDSPLACSSLYRTAPWGRTDQAAFLNIAVVLATRMTPHELLQATQAMERRHGRIPGERWGPRSLDVDIVLWNNAVIASPELRIPHPLMHDRAFVLVPLAEIAPGWQHPVLHVSVADLAARVPDREGVVRQGPLA